MSKGSEARRRQRSHLRASSVSGTRPSANLTAALAMAESTYQREAAASTIPPPPDLPEGTDPNLPRARAPIEAEEHFFARGEAISSLRPSGFDAPDVDLDEVSNHLSPQLIERRARMRRIVAGVVGAAAVLTAVVAAKAWVARPSTAALSESSFRLSNAIVPSIAMTAQQESAPSPIVAGLPATAPEPFAEPQGVHRLPIVNVEIPAVPDAETNRAWETAAQSVYLQDFKQADKALAELGKRADPATREAARLARAVWWMANGKEAEVRTVIADLAANATTPSVVKQARELLRAN